MERPHRPTDEAPVADGLLVLLLGLLEGPDYGYGIRRRLDELSDGVISLSTGAVYQGLGTLRARSLIRRVPPPTGTAALDPRRVYYELTPAGRRAIERGLTIHRAIVSLANRSATSV